VKSRVIAQLALLGVIAPCPLPAQAQPPAEAHPGSQPSAPTPATPAPVPPTANASTPAPAHASPPPPPPAYPYPPPYGYAPGYVYPPGYPPPAPYGYPGYPPGYTNYPAPPQQPPATPPPDLPPSGKWRVGGALLLIPRADLTYDLKYRDEPLDYYDRGVSTTVGVAAFAEYDVFSHLFVGFSLQYLPSIKWKSLSVAAGATAPPFGGSAREYDVLPQIGGYWNATPRLRLLVYVAPGYSLLDASSLETAIPIKHETVHGFVLQTGGGLLYAIGQQGFFAIRGLYQRSSHKGQVSSPTTGQTAEPNYFFSFFALQGSGGFWF
jgi:hypothetical protein